TTIFTPLQISEARDYYEFLNEISDITEDIKYVVNNFYTPNHKFFYIDEMKDYIGIDYGKDANARLRRQFRTNLISQFERKDHYYNVFTARKMVEAAHIKPFSQAANDEEKTDSDNGILLSPDIHKLFDSGAITFDKNGHVIYTTNKNSEPFNISKEEVQRLELNNHSLDSNILNKKRLEYLKYHRENVYQKGV
ncbi:MAG: HNH endonuclease, partial [Mycoplasmataceae bacterium]|nr:HNH endonuclease [Mycoplasmataceae bacterium]